MPALFAIHPAEPINKATATQTPAKYSSDNPRPAGAWTKIIAAPTIVQIQGASSHFAPDQSGKIDPARQITPIAFNASSSLRKPAMWLKKVGAYAAANAAVRYMQCFSRPVRART